MFFLSLFSIAVVFLYFLFCAHLLLTKNGNIFLNRLLGILILLRACQFLFVWLTQNGQIQHLAYVYKIPYALLYITPALFYLYIKGFISDQTSLKRHEWLHFLPLIIGVADMLPWMMSSLEYKRQMLEVADLHQTFFFQHASDLIPSNISRMFRASLFLFYLFLSWRFVIRKGIHWNLKANSMGKNWVICLLLLSSIGYLFLLLSIWWDTLHPERADAGIYAALQFAIFPHVFMIIYMFYQPRLLYGYVLVSQNSIFSQPTRNISHTQVSPLAPIMTNPIDSGKPWLGSLIEKESIPEFDRQQQPASPEKTDLWRQLVHEYMTTEKPFLQQSFRLQDLAIAIDIPQHHCSYIINYLFERNFNEWVNEYRVAYFIRSYTYDASRLTLEALAREAGFGNRRSLHNAFMKIHGQPPGIYLQKLITA